VFNRASGTFSNALASTTVTASFRPPLLQRLSVRPPQPHARARARALKHCFTLRRPMGSWSARDGAYAHRSRDMTAVVASRLQRVRSRVCPHRAWHFVRGLRVAPPNHAFQGSAGQQGWPVPSSLRSSAPPERERWAS